MRQNIVVSAKIKVAIRNLPRISQLEKGRYKLRPCLSLYAAHPPSEQNLRVTRCDSPEKGRPGQRQPHRHFSQLRNHAVAIIQSATKYDAKQLAIRETIADQESRT
jgi:hypothetical protein